MSEQRLKKLRGSGGYVVATVDDDQQRKGNLGGPDLFLAPVGRLEEGTISKYYCNTCEKDYEGSPRIDFENPNEDVAENLVLTERGQYSCSVCGSTIAEYREFKKPDEMADVGLAKPVDAAPTADAESVMDAPAPAEPPSYSPPADVQDESGQVRAISGMSIFDENGVKVGIAKQVGVDSSQNVVLVATGDDGADVSIPWKQVSKIGQIILLGGSSAPNDACGSCGFKNKGDSKFCEQCGTKL